MLISSGVVTNLEGDSSETTLDVDSSRSSFPVHISSEDLSGDELVDIFGVAEDSDYDHSDDGYVVVEDRGSHPADFQNVEAGEYNFTIESGDTAAETTASITVTEEDISVDFAQSTFVEERSNVADVTVDFDNADNAYLVVGDESEVNYEVVLEVTPDENDDEVNVSMNTATAHSVDSTGQHDAFTADNDASVEVVDVVHENNLEDPLAAGDYQLDIAGNYDAGELSEEYDTAYLTLEERTELSEDTVQTHTAPQGDITSVDDFEDATVTETDQIAVGDQMLVTVETSSLYGYLGDDADLASDGISLSVTEQDSSLNAAPQVWSTSPEDDETQLNADLISANQSEEYLVFAIDYNNLYEGDVADFDGEQSFDANFTVSTDNDYVSDDDESAESEFTLEERNVEWDDSVAEVPNSADALVTGTTNVAPGTEMTTRARAPGTFVTFNDVEVSEDRTFGAEYDFSEYNAGTEFTLRVTDPVTSNHVTADSTLVESEEEEEAEANLDWNVDVDPAEPVAGDDVDVTVSAENLGDETGNASYEFIFNGETLLEGDDVELEGGESDSWTDTVEEAPAGDYDWELKVDGEVEDSGTLTVAEADENGDENGAENGDEEPEEGEEEGTPGFGVAVAVVALLAAAMLALRRQN
ncbi:BGTF surface domain-containing protein [Natronorubrum aibiense]|uniref:PGF-CTERM sorting domain-containing protein n=1 Tax=Natronorubrum aibiense TaxID=348826 RepID=A0A5P9NZ35_9EURY|nr:BGTF surface domain-containing protein [Natronorubrum aibiense]QFU81159.1 PGF-CTERM sorting domain-containing protein [Natronorubrum aibiense]